MTRAVGEPTHEMEGPAEHAPASGGIQLERWQSALMAVATLVFVYGVAFGVTAAGGAVFHALEPAKQVDIFAALHSMWVVGALLGITVLWLLPPHPWAKRVIGTGTRERPAQGAGEAEDGDERVVAGHPNMPGPEPASRPIERRWAARSPLGSS